MAIDIGRRKFFGVLGGAASSPAIWPRTARAQPGPMRRIGILMGIADDAEGRARLKALLQGLEVLGWTEDRNLRIDYRFAAGNADRIRAYADELIAFSPALIVANTSPVVAMLQRKTSSIPIIFAAVNDPQVQGFVASLARPGGNITGFSLIEFPIIGKWIGLLQELDPRLKHAAVMFNPDVVPFYRDYLRSFAALPRTSATDATAAEVRNISDIEQAMIRLADAQGGALVFPPDPFTVVQHQAIIQLAQQHSVPAVFNYRTFVAEGAMMSYGPDTSDIFRRAASYVDRVLQGANPADLPVQQPTKFELAINLKTAKALGLSVPNTLLVAADEVIE